MVSDSIRSFDKTHEEIRHIQENTFFPVKDTKTLTLIEKIPFSEKKSATGPARCQNKLESSMFVEIV